MKKVIAAAVLVLLVSGLAFAQPTDDSMAFDGTIVDCKSMDMHKDDADTFLITYTKEVALMPEAIESGYGIYLEDGFMKFDKESTAKIIEFLKGPDSTLQVIIRANIAGVEKNILSLVSITNK